VEKEDIKVNFMAPGFTSSKPLYAWPDKEDVSWGKKLTDTSLPDTTIVCTTKHKQTPILSIQKR